jgi:hypothetical protein
MALLLPALSIRQHSSREEEPPEGRFGMCDDDELYTLSHSKESMCLGRFTTQG